MKIWPIACRNDQKVGSTVLPNTKSALVNMPKTFKLANWQN